MAIMLDPVNAIRPSVHPSVHPSIDLSIHRHIQLLIHKHHNGNEFVDDPRRASKMHAHHGAIQYLEAENKALVLPRAQLGACQSLSDVIPRVKFLACSACLNTGNPIRSHITG